MFANPGWADDAPIPLVPDQSDAQPTPLPPPTVSPAVASPGVPIPTGNPLDQRVQVQGLAAIDPGNLGLLDAEHGGLPADLWANTDLSVVGVLLQALPTGTPSRALRGLMQRLLLTAGPPPQHNGQNAAQNGASFIELRARALWLMGNLQSLESLLALIPAASQPPAVQHIAINVALLKGDTGRACALSQSLASIAPDDVYPAEISVYCKLADGKPGEAELGLEVLRDQKLNDPAFFAIADAIANGGKVNPTLLADPSPLSLALARYGKIALPPPSAETLPALLAAVANAPNATPEGQLAAAERAEAAGTLDIDHLRQIYLALPTTPQELIAALTAASAAKQPASNPRGRALLYRAIVEMPNPPGKAALIAKVLQQVEGSPEFFAAARLYAPVVAALNPTPDLVEYARPLARALFAAERPDLAQNWFDMARAQSFLGDAGANSGARAAAALLPVARVVQPNLAPVTPALFAAWRKSLPDMPQDKADRAFAIAVSLYSALGEKVPEEAWLPLLSGPPVLTGHAIRPALKQILGNAVTSHSAGLTTLTVLVALGGVPFNEIDPDDLNRLISALKAAGLDGDARAIAIEAALANGL